MKFYPIFLNLKDKKTVVIGGGQVAERKVLSLIKAGASVTVISPNISKKLKKLKDKGTITHIKRNYRKGDIKDAFIVIAGTSSVQINTKVAQDAPHLINVIDAPSEGNFIVPSFIKRGHLTIAISTEGVSPAVSKAIRKKIESWYSMEFASYLRFLEQIRKKAKKKITDNKKREEFLKSLASEKIINTLRKKGFVVTSKKILTTLESLKQ